MNATLTRIVYVILAVLGAGITALIPLMLAGQVPIPREWLWATPVIVAMLIALAAFLPKVGREDISGLVDQVGPYAAKVALKREAAMQSVATAEVARDDERRQRDMEAGIGPALRREREDR